MDISSIIAAVSMQASQTSQQIALTMVKQNAQAESQVVQALTGASAQAAAAPGLGSLLDVLA